MELLLCQRDRALAVIALRAVEPKPSMIPAGDDVDHRCRRHVARFGVFNSLLLHDVVMISEHLVRVRVVGVAWG